MTRSDGSLGLEAAPGLIDKARQVVLREAAAIKALAEQFDSGLERVVRLLIECRGHILTTGAGTSHAMAQRFAHLLSCCGVPALCIDAGDALHGGAGAITSNDVLFVISKGGQSAEVNQLAQIAKERGAKVVAQTENPDSALARLSDAVYRVQAVGDVDPYGMIATGSSLVNGAAGDVLCALLLEAKRYTREEFGRTHPAGAVGRKLSESLERGTGAEEA